MVGDAEAFFVWVVDMFHILAWRDFREEFALRLPLLNRHNAQRLKQIEVQLAAIDVALEAMITQDASQRMSRLNIWLADDCCPGAWCRFWLRRSAAMFRQGLVADTNLDRRFHR